MTKTQMAYFASDGNYGMENGNFAFVDVSQWNDSDWDSIESALDWERPMLANAISQRYKNA